MAYTPSYTKPYPSGYKNKPNETTPITADVMNGYDNAIVSIETYLAEGGGGSASIAYGDEDAFNEWSETAQNGEVFIRTDDNGSIENFVITFNDTWYQDGDPIKTFNLGNGHLVYGFNIKRTVDCVVGTNYTIGTYDATKFPLLARVEVTSITSGVLGYAQFYNGTIIYSAKNTSKNALTGIHCIL